MLKRLYRPALFLALVLLILAGPAFPFAFQPGDTTLPSFFSGVRVEDGTWQATVGSTIPITGAIYTFAYGDAGTGGTIATEFTWLFNPFNNFYLGPIAGPNIQSAGGEGDALSYLTGAVGIVAAYGKDFGIWGAGKYKFRFEESGAIQGWLVGFGVYFGVK